MHKEWKVTHIGRSTLQEWVPPSDADEAIERMREDGDADPEGTARLNYPHLFPQEAEPVASIITSRMHELEQEVGMPPLRTLAAPAPAVPMEGINADAVAQAMDGDAGRWLTCSGCYDTEDGHPTQRYAYSSALHCHLGLGCSECGGLGAVWDTTDYAEMADWLAKELVADADQEAALRAPQPAQQVKALPKLTDKMIEAAMVAHYGKRSVSLGIHGVDLTENDKNWTFAQGFRRMWKGVAASLSGEAQR